MKGLLFCASLVIVSTLGEAFPRPGARAQYNNGYENRYDDVRSAEVDSLNEVASAQANDKKTEPQPSKIGPHPDSEVESVEIVGNKNYENSDDSYDEYELFFPSLRRDDDFQRYFAHIFKDIEKSLRDYQPFGNQFLTDPFQSQYSPFNSGSNSAHAYVSAGPDGTHQIAAISPENPGHGSVSSKKDEATTPTAPSPPVYPWFSFMPNFNNLFNPVNGVNSHKDSANNGFIFPSWTDSFSYYQPNVDTFSDKNGAYDSSRSGKPKHHFTSVSAFSSSSSQSVNGHNVNHKSAETVVNRDGQITRYKVQD